MPLPETVRLQSKLEERLIDIMDNPEHRACFSRPALAMTFRAGYTAGAGVALEIMRREGWTPPPAWKKHAD